MRRILCLYLPDWPIQRLRGEREIQNAECRMQNAADLIILHARDPRRGELVIACHRAARERGGTQPGMPLAEAVALAKHGSYQAGGRAKVHILPHDPAADLAALARLAEHCERYSPLVGWETVEGGRRSEVGSQKSASWGLPGPDCLFLDVTGIGVLFGGEETLARAAVVDFWLNSVMRPVWRLLGRSERRGGQQGFRVQGSGFRVHPRPPIPDSRPPTPCLPSALHIPHSALCRSNYFGYHKKLSTCLPNSASSGSSSLALPEELGAGSGERLLLRIDQLLGTAQETIMVYRPPPRFIEEWIFDFPGRAAGRD